MGIFGDILDLAGDIIEPVVDVAEEVGMYDDLAIEISEYFMDRGE